MGSNTDPTVASLLDILHQKWPRPEPEFGESDGAYTVESSSPSSAVPSSQDNRDFSELIDIDLTTELLPTDLATPVSQGTGEWETTSPMTTIELTFGDVLSLYYGFIIAILILAIIVMLIIIFLCCERLNKSRRRVVFASPREAPPSAVCSGANARREVFESLASRDLAEEMPTLSRVSPKVEVIPMREIASPAQSDVRTHRPNEISQTESRLGFRDPPPLARVYAAKRWTPDFNNNLIRVRAAGSSSATTGRSTVRLSGARGGSSRYVARSLTVSSHPSRKVRLPKYNLAGEAIRTPSDPSFVREVQRRSSETEVLNHRRGNESSLIVPTNSPNCSSDEENSGSVFLPGDGTDRPLAPDSDFGASAGVSHCNVSSITSTRGAGESMASNSYVWDGYDPSFRRRPLSYVDGAYYPVLGERQYWV